MKISVNGEWLDAPLIIMTCQSCAGICEKPIVTFGEGHVCSLPVGHSGLHLCARCDKEFNSNSCAPWIARAKEENLWQEALRLLGI